jgi:hypothetical protein
MGHATIPGTVLWAEVPRVAATVPAASEGPRAPPDERERPR